MNTIRLNILGEAKAASSGDIKNQDKSVEIVENGVTEVTADSGYTGLGKVTINANVQGGEGEGGTPNIEEYWSIDESKVTDDEKFYYTMCLAYTSRVKVQGQVTPVGALLLAASGISGCKFSSLDDVASVANIKSLREIVVLLSSQYPDMINFFDRVFTLSNKEEFYA